MRAKREHDLIVHWLPHEHITGGVACASCTPLAAATSHAPTVLPRGSPSDQGASPAAAIARLEGCGDLSVALRLGSALRLIFAPVLFDHLHHLRSTRASLVALVSIRQRLDSSAGECRSPQHPPVTARALNSQI